jgi:hypothetical protein
MTAPRRNPAAGIAAGVALAALAATPALAQSQDAGRTLANGESIVIDGRTFSITPGTSNNDLASPSGQPGARRLGAGVVIFRSGDGLYMVDRAPSPSTATTADTPASGPPRADGPRNSTVDCGRVSAVRDQGASAPPNPNVLETVRKIFSPWNLGDIDLNIRTTSCGVSNAWYQRVGKVPTVSICYEYLQEIWDSMPEETKAVVGESMKDAVCGQLFFAVAHELGHAMFDIFDAPVFGRQEDAADQFATFMMLQFGGEQALQLINGAAYGYHAYIKDLSTKQQVTLPLAALSSDHGTPEERYFNLICIAYGYDQRLFSLEMNKIPPNRAQKCRDEYEDIKYAMHTVFWSHLDHDKVKRVLAMKWFIDINANTSTSKAN